MRLVTLCLLLVGLSCVARASVVLLAEPGFPHFLANQMLSPWELGRDFEACGLPVRLATVEELPDQLATPDTEALVMLNGSCWPESAGQALADFWRRGGSLV